MDDCNVGGHHMSQHEQLELIWQEVLNIMASDLQNHHSTPGLKTAAQSTLKAMCCL